MRAMINVRLIVPWRQTRGLLAMGVFWRCREATRAWPKSMILATRARRGPNRISPWVWGPGTVAGSAALGAADMNV